MVLTELVLLTPKAGAVQPNASWCECACRSLLLPCGHLRRALSNPFDIVVDKIDIGAASLGFLSAKVSLYLARAGLVRMLGTRGGCNVLFGNVVDSQKQPIKAWRTVWTRSAMVVRGGMESHLRFCSACGVPLYWAWPRECYHIVHDESAAQNGADNGTVFLSDIGLLVAPQVADDVRSARLKGIAFTSVQISENPMDGFPKDLTSLRDKPDLWRPPQHASPAKVDCHERERPTSVKTENDGELMVQSEKPRHSQDKGHQ